LRDGATTDKDEGMNMKAIDKKSIAWGVALVLIAAGYRVLSGVFLTSLPNFSPVMAMAFCGALVLPGALAIVVPLVALFASDLILNAHFGQPLLSIGMVAIYACYLVAIGLGRALRQSSLAPIFGATVFNCLLFYVVTNAFAWFANPSYPQNIAGLWQSLTLGLPGFPPTWTFLRNSLISDVLFTGVFIAGYLWLQSRQETTAPVATKVRG